MSNSDAPSSKRMGGNTGTLMSAVSEMASSITEYLQISMDIDEIHDKVFMAPDLDEDQITLGLQRTGKHLRC